MGVLSYEKSQMFFLLRQLAQRDTLSFVLLIVVLLCLLPRWVLCFLVAALALGCGALVMMKR